MIKLSENCINIINSGYFTISDPGPLHYPVKKFSLSRDDQLRLSINTELFKNSVSKNNQLADGITRINTDRVKLINPNNATADLIGIVPYLVNWETDGVGAMERHESANIHSITLNTGDIATAKYTIDWLENVPDSPFIWPDNIEVVNTDEIVYNIANEDRGISISGYNERFNFSKVAAKLLISGVTFYVCALRKEENQSKKNNKAGCIIYDGTPSEAFRKKIRIALSFALGVYLVDLGYSIYDHKWQVVSAFAQSAYSLRGHAFNMRPEQLAPLGFRFLFELDKKHLTRALNAFVSFYDELELTNLSWAYWHACSAPTHFGPAHFGAAIESLQGRYMNSHADAIVKNWLSPAMWTPLKEKINSSIRQVEAPVETQAALIEQVGNLNRIGQRLLLRSIFDSLGLQLSKDEDIAWRRRNKAAHGMPIPQGEELSAIRDTKLLRGIFQRMLLRITDAADQYIDYTSPNYPYRPLSEAPPSQTS